MEKLRSPLCARIKLRVSQGLGYCSASEPPHPPSPCKSHLSSGMSWVFVYVVLGLTPLNRPYISDFDELGGTNQMKLPP